MYAPLLESDFVINNDWPDASTTFCRLVDSVNPATYTWFVTLSTTTARVSSQDVCPSNHLAHNPLPSAANFTKNPALSIDGLLPINAPTCPNILPDAFPET